MTVGQLLKELIAGDIALEARHVEVIHLEPKSRLTPELIEAVRHYKAVLLAHLRTEKSDAPNSRSPLVRGEVRHKIEAIEADARAKGWPAELLWNAGFWDCPPGLAAVLDPDDQIAQVTPDCITILKSRRDLLRFRRRAV